MKKISVTLVLILTLFCCFALSSCNSDEKPDEIQSLSFADYLNNPGTLLWSDEFDGTEVDTSKWIVMGSDAPVADHAAYWTKDCVSVSDGFLTISAYKDDNFFYTGALNSQTKYASKYGYYEIRCKIPELYGLWAAFWMLPEDQFAYQSDDNLITKNTDKYGAEIDIFEASYSPANEVQHTIHIGGDRGEQNYILAYVEPESEENNFYNSFHKFGLYWDESHYVFLIDGEVMWATDYNGHVSHADEYLCVTMHAGGSSVNGVPNPGKTGSSTTWRASLADRRNVFSEDNCFVVDYVRHYALYDGPDAIPENINKMLE